MACFSAFFWSRRKEEGAVLTSSDNAPWFISGVEPHRILPPAQVISKQVYTTYRSSSSFCDNLLSDLKFLSCDKKFEVEPDTRFSDVPIGMSKSRTEDNENRCSKSLHVSKQTDFEVIASDNSSRNEQVATQVPDRKLSSTTHVATSQTEVQLAPEATTPTSTSPDGYNRRFRRTGVYEITKEKEDTQENNLSRPHVNSINREKEIFSEDNLLKTMEKSMDFEKKDDSSETDNETLLLPPVSGYCSSTASAGSEDEYDKVACQKNSVRRCESSDSAIVHSDEETVTVNSNWGEKKEELDELPYNYPVFSPYSPRRSVDHENVPSRTLIEAQFVPYPLDRKFSDCFSETSDIFNNDSRRQSCFTDDSEEVSRYRYWRTPSVVVSDYSDDPMGLTLEDIEYIRSQQKDSSSSPDSSLHSSWSNLNLMGWNSENLRKISDCSTCSFSPDEDSEYSREPSPWRKIRNFVQWTPFFQTYKKQRYPWVQLAGHQGNFKAGPDQGTILKKLCLKEEKCFQVLMDDVLRPFVPEYKGIITSDDGECSFIQLQDLLSDFISPCVMDCKIGVRTYLEEELAKAKEKPKLRKDMYDKMCQIDNTAPTEEEHKMKGVTKPRYMVWRETISSTATLGFRIEGIRKADGTSSKDFKTVKTRDQVMKEFTEFAENFPHAVPKYIQRLKAIKATLESSSFFQTHEVIGSSLLFVHDKYNANVWLIDFAKTLKLPEDISITHKDKWKVGNHEDGYLIGVDNLIAIFKSILENYPVLVSPPLSLPDTPDIEINEKSQENT